MKKFVIPVILAAIFGVGGGVTAVIITGNNAKNQETVYSAPPAEELKLTSGRYYLNGDKNQKIWLDVNPDFLTLNGDDSDVFLMNYAKKAYENYDNADEVIQSYYEDMKLLYCGEKIYSIESLSETIFVITISRYGDNASYADPIEDKASFACYKAENRIHLSVGDFILAED